MWTGPAALIAPGDRLVGFGPRGVSIKFLDCYPKPVFMRFAKDALSLASTAKLRRTV